MSNKNKKYIAIGSGVLVACAAIYFIWYKFFSEKALAEKAYRAEMKNSGGNVDNMPDTNYAKARTLALQKGNRSFTVDGRVYDTISGHTVKQKTQYAADRINAFNKKEKTFISGGHTYNTESGKRIK